jgi:hypothetical protein
MQVAFTENLYKGQIHWAPIGWSRLSPVGLLLQRDAVEFLKAKIPHLVHDVLGLNNLLDTHWILGISERTLVGDLERTVVSFTIRDKALTTKELRSQNATALSDQVENFHVSLTGLPLLSRFGVSPYYWFNYLVQLSLPHFIIPHTYIESTLQ